MPVVRTLPMGFVIYGRIWIVDSAKVLNQPSHEPQISVSDPYGTNKTNAIQAVFFTALNYIALNADMTFAINDAS
jgi:hypothetical protein